MISFCRCVCARSINVKIYLFPKLLVFGAIFFYLNDVRKCHYDHYMASAHIKGIGGPGAPHCFRLERIADAGCLSLPTFYLVDFQF